MRARRAVVPSRIVASGACNRVSQPFRARVSLKIITASLFHRFAGDISPASIANKFVLAPDRNDSAAVTAFHGKELEVHCVHHGDDYGGEECSPHRPYIVRRAGDQHPPGTPSAIFGLILSRITVAKI